MSGQQFKQYFKNGDTFWKWCFIISQSVSIILVITSFFLPPTGEVNSSVFAAVGEIFAFPALLSFYNIVMSGKSASITKGSTVIQVNKDEEKEENK